MVPKHKADALATVVCLEGKIDFTASGQTVQLVPGSFLTMESNELHSLYGVKDSHVLVIQQLKY
ncbi:AraC family ligand binding domain-containing protein [Streptococcus anginosus]|nr:AraC family ligand binding domain-containing protein [Streptococcus anginosus]